MSLDRAKYCFALFSIIIKLIYFLLFLFGSWKKKKNNGIGALPVLPCLNSLRMREKSMRLVSVLIVRNELHSLLSLYLVSVTIAMPFVVIAVVSIRRICVVILAFHVVTLLINMKLKKKLLKSYLTQKYGKRQGKKLFKRFRRTLKHEYHIK